MDVFIAFRFIAIGLICGVIIHRVAWFIVSTVYSVFRHR